MSNFVSDIIDTEGNKTVSAIYYKLTCNQDRRENTSGITSTWTIRLNALTIIVPTAMVKPCGR